MNYIIKGGEFNNKGAEAMSLIAIYNILKNDASASIYFLNSGYDTAITKDINITLFRISRAQLNKLAGKSKGDYYAFRLINYLKYFLKRKSYIYNYEFKNNQSLFLKADYFIDISGYALSTVWGTDEVDYYLTWLEAIYQQNPKCEMYLMPQSFGPFDDSFNEIRAQKILSKCKKIYVRERKGYDSLLKLNLSNIEFCYDSVLIEKDYSPATVIKNINQYKEIIKLKNTNNICIIPNVRLFDTGSYNIEKLMQTYYQIIEKAKADGFDIYLVPHAGEDITICNKIKDKFLQDERVHIIGHVMNSFNYEEFIKKMNFIVASRYHSVVHAYKEGVPAVIIGWSDKYMELASAFEQDQYIIDSEHLDHIISTYCQLAENYENEQRMIIQKLIKIQDQNCYQFLIPKVNEEM